MSQLMPKNEDDMLKIDGVTKSNLKKFGQPLLEITQQASADKDGILINYSSYYIRNSIAYNYLFYLKINYLLH